MDYKYPEYEIPPMPREHDETWTALHYCTYDITNWEDKYPSILDFVGVRDVDVRGDEETALENVAHYDDRKRIVYDDVPDWYAKPDGLTVTVGCGLPAIGWSVEWKCAVPNCIERRDESIDWAFVEEFQRLAYGFSQPMFSSRGRDLALSDKMVDALLAYLQAHAPMQKTPMDLEAQAHKFFEYAAGCVKEHYRQKYSQPIWKLAKGAMDTAQPTPTGIDALDSIIGGGLVPGVYIVAGDPGAGKTALVTQALMFAAHGCSDDEMAVYVMLDQGGPSEIAKRMISLSWAIDADSKGTMTDKGKLSKASSWDWSTLVEGNEICERLTNNRVVLLDLMDGSFSEMKRKLDELTRFGDVRIKLLVVDYVQLLADIGNEDSSGGTVATDAGFASAVIRNLRTWATDNAVPVLLVGQFSKESIQRHSKGGAPEMTDLLGSVDVPYQAESVICLTNAHDGSGIVQLMDVKHRHAGNDAQEGRKARLHLDGEHGYFTELD